MKQSRYLIKKVLLTTSFIGAVLTGNAQRHKTDKSVGWADTLKVLNNGQVQAAFKEVSLKKKFFKESPEQDIYTDYKKITRTYQSNIDAKLYVVLAGKYESDFSKDVLLIHSKRIIYKDEQQNIQYAIFVEGMGVSPKVDYMMDSAGVFKVHHVQMFTDMLFFFFARNVASRPELLIELVRNKIALQEKITAVTQDKPRQEVLSITQKLKQPFLLNYIDTITVVDNEGKSVKAYKDVSEYSWSNHRTYQSTVDKNLYLNISYNHVNGDDYMDNDAANLTFIYGGSKTDDNHPSIEVKRQQDENFVIAYDMGVRDPSKATGQIVQMDPILYGNMLRDLTQRPNSIPEIVKEKIAFKASL
jgi:uncharacterized membrane protein